MPDEPCPAGRNLDVAPPFEAALVAMRLGSAIPTASVSPSCDLSADVKTGGARSSLGLCAGLGTETGGTGVHLVAAR